MKQNLLHAITVVVFVVTLTTFATPPKDEITVAAVGDIMLGSTFPTEESLPPDDGAKLLAAVAPILRAADLTFGNLEGPMIDGGKSSKCPPGSTAATTTAPTGHLR